MTRRTYIYWALPLFVLLSCGQLLVASLGAFWALVVAVALIVVAWGVVWVRLYGLKYRPEFAILSVLPHGFYFVCRYDAGTQLLFQESPTLQNLYALAWLGFAGVGIASMRCGACDPTPLPARRDAVFILMVPLILLYSISTFTHCIVTLTSLS